MRLSLALLLAGCGASMDGTLPDGGASVIPVDGGSGISATRAGLVSIAQTGAYLAWKAEPMVHQTTGPHGDTVRTFVNEPLCASLKAGNTTHPIGSVVVKELFSSGTRTGWAVDAKGDDGVWVFFEGFEPQLNQYFFRGTGNLCANCHASGVDFVLTKAAALP